MASSFQWSAEKAVKWQSDQPWVVGCNFLPSTAINQLELWQKETFDLKTIDQELGWAASIGMNAVRVYLHDLAYEVDPAGLLSRMDEFLSVASKHGIRALFVFFDDCWNHEVSLGKQPDPKPGVHNSGWVNSPAENQRAWPADLARLETYVKAVLTRFASDERVYGWDLYNEPGGGGYELASMVLLEKAFEWAWSVRPSQPLTVGLWYANETFNAFQASSSDVVSFHNYENADHLTAQISRLRSYGRPLVCTEWMARKNGSVVEVNLSVFKQEGVACFNWGLVDGKSNTKFPWGSPEGGPEPDPWFHELFHPDGQPYLEAEAGLFRELTGRS